MIVIISVPFSSSMIPLLDLSVRNVLRLVASRHPLEFAGLLLTFFPFSGDMWHGNHCFFLWVWSRKKRRKWGKEEKGCAYIIHSTELWLLTPKTETLHSEIQHTPSSIDLCTNHWECTLGGFSTMNHEDKSTLFAALWKETKKIKVCFLQT